MIEVCPSESGSHEYTLTISYDNGNATIKHIKVIVKKNGLSLKLNASSSYLCASGDPVKISAIASNDGEFVGFDYLWSNGSTEEAILVSEPGIYGVTVTANKCEIVESIEIKEPEINIYPTDLTKCGDEPLPITVISDIEISNVDWPEGIEAGFWFVYKC